MVQSNLGQTVAITFISLLSSIMELKEVYNGIIPGGGPTQTSELLSLSTTAALGALFKSYPDPFYIYYRNALGKQNKRGL